VYSFYDICFVLAANSFVALIVEADVLYDVCILRPLMVNHLAAKVTCKLMRMTYEMSHFHLFFKRSKRIEQCINTPDSLFCNIQDFSRQQE